MDRKTGECGRVKRRAEIHDPVNDGGHDTESCLRDLADSLGESLLLIREGRVLLGNDRFAALSGVSREDVSGRPLLDFLVDDTESQPVMEAFSRRERGDAVPPPGEIRIRRHDGASLFMRCRSGPIDWEGAPATVLFLEDITSMKSAERQLMEQKEMNSIMTDAVRRILASPLSLDEIAQAILDSAIDLTKSRAGALLLDDGSRGMILERKCGLMCDHCRLPDILQRILADEDFMKKCRPGRIDGAFYLNGPFDTPIGCPGSSEISSILRVPAWSPEGVGSLSGQIVLLDSAGGFGPWDLDSMEKVVEVLNLAMVQSRFIDQLEAARDRAEQESNARSRFLANIGHEIRSPLNGVMMMASMLKDSPLDQDQREQLDIVLFSARTIDRLIRDITDLTLIGTGKLTIQEEAFDLRELCRHIIETNRPEALRKGLEMDAYVADEARRIIGDRERTGQIITNLITNAIKYTEKGSIRLTAVMENGMVRMDVTDTGVGIPDELQASVFDLFRQGDGRRRMKGAGIGLFVVKSIVEMMDGSVELRSRVGKGSRFTILLPMNHDVANLIDDALTGGPGKKTESPKVLVAEDEGVNRLFLRTILEREGYEVDEAVDGVEAVALARRYDYDLILMDINMPRMDGLEAISFIRQSRPKVPVVAVTANAYQEERRRIRECGADDIVLKPIDEADLRRRLERFVRM